MKLEFDLFIIGGGINGAGIARDAAGRGYSVCLCEAADLGSGTSSASTKLIHGGLRYLEHYEFRLVREALMEREVIWKIAPHIVKPLRFILPHHKGLRPKWLLRLGLFLYDYIGGRKLLPPARNVNLRSDETGKPLKPQFTTGFEYSDCWVNDSRLVVLNALDAEIRGADIRTRTRVQSAEYRDGKWQIRCLNTETDEIHEVSAKMIINAAGPWVDDVLRNVFGINQANNVRLVRGSHIVIAKKFEHDKCYIFQNSDGRIVFAIPYEDEYTMIGTTDAEQEQIDGPPQITDQEIEYLCELAGDYFVEPVSREDIVWTFAGVRPLYDDGASAAQEATRDYVLVQEEATKPGLLVNIFGGKITTYRKLAESMLEEIGKLIGEKGSPWTNEAALPGGDFEVGTLDQQVMRFADEYPFLDKQYLARLLRLYGTRTKELLKGVQNKELLGTYFGNNLYAKEVDFLIDTEYARNADDILFRRTRLGIRFDDQQKSELSKYVAGYLKNNS